MKYTREQKCRLLEEHDSLHGFFDLLCADVEAPAAYWLEGDQECSFSFGQMKENVLRCGGQIEQLGCGKRGEWIGLALETSRDWPVIFWGLVAAGRKPLLLDPMLDDGKLLYLLRQANADALVCAKPRAGVPLPQFQPGALLDGNAPLAVGDWSDELAFCTSGTTDTAKIYVYRGRAVCLQAKTIIHEQADEKITKESRGPLRTLCFLPLNHIFGFMTNMIWTWMLGYPQVFLRDRAPDTILRTCRTLKVQFATVVPLLVNNVCSTLQKRMAKESPEVQKKFRHAQELSLCMQKINPVWGLKQARHMFADIHAQLFGPQLEEIIIGGSHITEDKLRLFNSIGISTLGGFGMTETAVTSAEVRNALDSRLNGSLGWPFDIAEYRIIPDGSDPNHGELWIRSEAMHSGVLVNGEQLPPSLNSEGWYESGDVVRMDESKRIWVVGRVKDIIIGESGENIYPDEIEDSFTDLPGVEQFAVLGVKDVSGSEKVTLVMNVGPTAYRDPAYLNQLYQDIQQRNRQLPVLKKVHVSVATPEKLPLSSSMKVRRVQLREQIQENTMPYTLLDGRLTGGVQPEASAPTATEETKTCGGPEAEKELAELREQVRKTFAAVLETDPASISDTAHFIYDLGGDSLESISLSISLEEKFDLLIPTDAFMSCVCVNDVAQLLYNLRHGLNGQAVIEEHKPAKMITRFEDTPEHAAFQERLKGIEAAGDNPYFVCHESPLTDVSLMDGQEVLNFGSYNYVCMSGRPETEEAAIAAIRKYGTSASGSRLLAGEKKIHQELEQAIAQWKHAEAALVLVGGHSTNVTIVGNFCGPNDLIVYDAIAHNSIAEGCRLSSATSKPFPHNDVQALEGILKMQRHRFEKVLIVVEGAYSMDGDIAPVPELVELKKRYGCFLMVDEAHSACVLGETGGGVDEHFHLAPDDVDIKMGTLSKGLGTCGGYLAGKRCLIDYLRYSLPGFVFSVGISPPLAAAALEAIRLLQTRPQILEDLRRNIRVFVEEAHKRGLNTCLAGETAIIPILVGGDDEAFALSIEQGKHGVFVPPAVYPAVPRGKARLRYCVTSDHKPEQIIKALDILVETAGKMGIELPPMAQ